jgi:hypothetical protein
MASQATRRFGVVRSSASAGPVALLAFIWLGVFVVYVIRIAAEF